MLCLMLVVVGIYSIYEHNSLRPFNYAFMYLSRSILAENLNINMQKKLYLIIHMI